MVRRASTTGRIRSFPTCSSAAGNWPRRYLKRFEVNPEQILRRMFVAELPGGSAQFWLPDTVIRDVLWQAQARDQFLHHVRGTSAHGLGQKFHPVGHLL